MVLMVTSRRDVQTRATKFANKHGILKVHSSYEVPTCRCSVGVSVICHMSSNADCGLISASGVGAAIAGSATRQRG